MSNTGKTERNKNLLDLDRVLRVSSQAFTKNYRTFKMHDISVGGSRGKVFNAFDKGLDSSFKRTKVRNSSSDNTSQFNMVNNREIAGRPKIRLTLSNEQKNVFNEIIKGNDSVFFTGSAGTGKSVLLRELVHTLLLKHDRNEVAITASTGIAAKEICGVTLHSFSGIKLANGTLEQLVNTVISNRYSFKRWTKTKVIVIDEISMVDADLFDKLEALARIVRKSETPFGGIKVILCGDFMQLPPVAKNSKYAFEAKCWNALIKKTFVLKQIFRQRDLKYISVLEKIRNGKITNEVNCLLQGLSREPDVEKHKMVRLFPLRSQVDSFNEKVLKSLVGDEKTYIAKDTGPPESVHMLDKLLAVDKLVVKKKSLVMLIKNISDTLVNGSIGEVVSFDSESGCPNVSFNFDNNKNYTYTIKHETFTVESADGRVISTRFQIPLILAYAMSIHKSQGLTFDCVSVDLGNIFECGQAYVALSRSKTLDGLQVLKYHPDKIKINHRVISYYKMLKKNAIVFFEEPEHKSDDNDKTINIIHNDKLSQRNVITSENTNPEKKESC